MFRRIPFGLVLIMTALFVAPQLRGDRGVPPWCNGRSTVFAVSSCDIASPCGGPPASPIPPNCDGLIETKPEVVTVCGPVADASDRITMHCSKNGTTACALYYGCVVTTVRVGGVIRHWCSSNGFIGPPDARLSDSFGPGEFCKPKVVAATAVGE